MAILISLYACSEHPKEQQSADTPTSTQADQSRPASGLTFNEMPNEDTRYVTIETDSVDENETLLLALQTRLLKANFEFIEKDSGSSWSENDCSLNKVIQVKGEGVRIYTAQSKVGIGTKKNYFPDFTMFIFGFDNEAQAIQHFTTLKSAVSSNHGFCNGKAPENIVRNGNEIFYFTTHAEMFRGYINESADFIQNYKSIQ